MAHLFVSYSRKDFPVVDRLRNDLRDAGIGVWIDKVGLTPGTLSWEQALRDAIRAADAVLLCASPDSRESAYVRDEVAIAKHSNKPIYPAWVAGYNWMDCIPLGLGGTQYADMRAENYSTGLLQLIGAIRNQNTHIIPLVVDTPSSIAVPETNFEPRNPFKGLRAFRAGDRNDFFGRDLLVTELIDKLDSNQRFLAVIGPSGSGKSSVIMAGLLPRLHDGRDISGSEQWVILDPFIPGKHPIEALSIALAKHLPTKSQAAIDEDLLHHSTRGLHRLARQITEQRLVLYIDQFEELFTQTEREDERRQFIDLITTAANEPDAVLTIILTLRADFYDRPLSYSELGALIQSHSKVILPLTLADIYDVILKPAAQSDVRLTFEPGLVEEIAFSVRGEAGALPLLQFTLDQLFQLRDGQRLTRKDYEALGGVRGALAKHAEAAYQALDDEGRELSRTLFLRLIEPGATERDTTRRRIRFDDLELTNIIQRQRLRKIADIFIHSRLLTATLANDEVLIEISHEALIREWDRYAEWIRVYAEDVSFRSKLQSDIQKWMKSGSADDLYRGTQLIELQEWSERNDITVNEATFLERSTEYELTRVKSADEHRRLLKLTEFYGKIITSRNRTEVISQITQRLNTVISADVMVLWKRSGNVLVPESAYTFVKSASFTPSSLHIENHPVFAQVIATQQPVIGNNSYHLSEVVDNYLATVSIDVPLVNHGYTIGVLSLYRVKPSFFDEESVQLLLDFANLIATAIANTDLYRTLTTSIFTIVNHEFGSPLSGIVGFSELLKDMDIENIDRNEMASTVKVIRQGTDRIRHMIENFILLLQLEYGEAKQVFEWRKHDIDDLDRIVHDACKQAFEREGVVHTYIIEADQPIPRIVGDEIYLGMTFFSLIDNAIKFSPSDYPVEIKIFSENDMVKVSVKDYGHGIPENEMSNIWKSFYQLDRARYEQHGTGSGLAIAYQLVELHAGSIEVESHPKSGSVFTVILPTLDTFLSNANQLGQS